MIDQTKTGSEKVPIFDEIEKKKSILPPLVNPAAKNGFDIWNQREKLHQDHHRARWKLKVTALWNSLMNTFLIKIY